MAFLAMLVGVGFIVFARYVLKNIKTEQAYLSGGKYAG